MAERKLLAADLGGTKTNLAIFSTRAGLDNPLCQDQLVSAAFDSLALLLKDFLARHENIAIDAISIGVAGPVVEESARLTALQWNIDGPTTRKELGVKSLWLMNDLVATAKAIPYLKSADLYPVLMGKKDAVGTKAVIAPGTGLGEAYLVWDGKAYHAHASEGGHVDFAPADELQMQLLKFLRREYDHVSYENVCSGRGIPNIYAFLKENGHAQESREVEQLIATAADPTPIIMDRALHDGPGCALCLKTLQLFLEVLGAAAGNAALKFMASGGIYLGGGIPPRIAHEIGSDRFKEAFLNKGRLRHVLQDVPLYVILKPSAALLGAAAHGLGKLLSGE